MNNANLIVNHVMEWDYWIFDYIQNCGIVFTSKLNYNDATDQRTGQEW